jgi:hypothetical protein
MKLFIIRGRDTILMSLLEMSITTTRTILTTKDRCEEALEKEME